ncbi:MAG: hypothetical protein K6F27_09680 [Ruminococcus sp.]|nr:hypothetical protein [Ruminococcus sp.]
MRCITRKIAAFVLSTVIICTSSAPTTSASAENTYDRGYSYTVKSSKVCAKEFLPSSAEQYIVGSDRY